MRLGGRLGENPPLMIGSIFYRGDRRVKDHERGIFDEEAEERLIESDLKLAHELNFPYALDVIITSREAAEPYLKFASRFNVPLLVDGIDPEVRAHAYRVAGELGLSDLAIANAIYPDSIEEELDAIRSSGIRKAVLVAFDPKNALESLKPEFKLSLLEEKLIPKAEEAGIEEFLVDVVVLDPASLASVAESMSFLRSRGYVVGCAPANALAFLSRRRYGDEAYPMLTAALSYLRMRGADFMIFGPAGRFRGVAKGLALLESMLAIEAKVPRSRLKEHPFSLLRELQRVFQEVSKEGI